VASSARAAALRGVLLDDRYRLEQVRDAHVTADGREVTLWLATDVPLDRRVAVVVTPTKTKRARRALVDAATRASRVGDGRCVRVLDVGELDEGGEPHAWVAAEWVDGVSLAALLRRGRLPAEVAVDVVRECAEALQAAARVGAHHGRLHPDEVLIASGGLPRITGVETTAALSSLEPTEAADVRALGALLFACVTGRWPLPGWAGLQAPEHDDRLHARSQSGDVPRAVDDVAARAMANGYADLPALVAALRQLPSRPIDAPAPPPAPARSQALRRWAWRIVPPLLVVVIAAGGGVLGSDLGRVPESARVHHATLPASTATAPGSGRLVVVWQAPPTVTSFDPEGDGEEDPDATGFAVDHDPSTSWTTDLYQHNSHFGGLKSGVGLLIDLGRPTTVRVAELALVGSGSDVELRAGNRTPRRAADLSLVESAAPTGAGVTWTLRPAVTARYWLVWFTNLPKARGGYRGGITDIALLGSTAG
jgi:hypothetical protein